MAQDTKVASVILKTELKFRCQRANQPTRKRGQQDCLYLICQEQRGLSSCELWGTAHVKRLGCSGLGTERQGEAENIFIF